MAISELEKKKKLNEINKFLSPDSGYNLFGGSEKTTQKDFNTIKSVLDNASEYGIDENIQASLFGSGNILNDKLNAYNAGDTDYFGEDESGKGRIGGIYGNSFANLTYSKKIGLDILDTYKSEFKFDIEVYAKYRAVGTNKNSINKVMLQSYRSSGTGSSGGWWWNRRRFFNSSSGYTDFSSSRLYDFDARPYR